MILWFWGFRHELSAKSIIPTPVLIGALFTLTKQSKRKCDVDIQQNSIRSEKGVKYWYKLQRAYNWLKLKLNLENIQFRSVAQSCPTLCDPVNLSTQGLPVHHQLPEFTQTHVHRVRDTIQPSHPLSSPSPPAPNRSQHQGLFQWVNSSHEVAKVLEFQFQHQSFQWTPRTDLL